MSGSINRVSSCSARDGTRMRCSSAKTLVPGRSRTDNRYESVATRRSPSGSAAINTPVRIGRESSELAAGTTWRNAASSAPGAMVTPSPTTSGSCGYSSAGMVRSVNDDGPASRWTDPSSSATSTAPGATTRTTSASSFAGTTTTPSSWPATSIDTVIVRSRSLPVMTSSSPVSARRRPASTAREPRFDTARPAVVSASSSTSRSHRNFTWKRSSGLSTDGPGVGEGPSGGSRCVDVWATPYLPRSGGWWRVWSSC